MMCFLFVFFLPVSFPSCPEHILLLIHLEDDAFALVSPENSQISQKNNAYLLCWQTQHTVVIWQFCRDDQST